VTNVYLNAMSVAKTPADVIDRLPSLVAEFRAVAS